MVEWKNKFRKEIAVTAAGFSGNLIKQLFVSMWFYPHEIA